MPDDVTTDSPFAPALSRESFLPTLGGGEALRRLDDGLGTREPFLLVTGDPGTGKSALANEAIARWGARVTAAYLTIPPLTGPELLEELLRRFGVEPPDGSSRWKLVACLEGVLAEIAGRGQVAIIVVDDAHHLSPELLEELRLVVNAAQQSRRPLEVLLVGLPALEATLDDPALAALRQRVSVRAKLDPLSPGETRRYIRHRVNAGGEDRSDLFPRKTCTEIAALSRGLPRQINALAAEALRLARASGRSMVEPGHVRDAVAALAGVLPKGEVEEPADAGPEVVSAPTLRPTEPPVNAAQTRNVEASVERTEGVAAQSSVPPVSHDSREWVARFVGQQGPLQISSQAISRSSWTPEQSEAADAIPNRPDETPPTRPSEAGGMPPRARPRRAGRLHMATTVSLATIGIITAVVLGLRAAGNARSHAANAGNAATTASVAPREAGTRAARATTTAGASERSSEASTALPRGPYTLDAGVRLDLQTALDERQRMQGLTGIEGWVVPAVGPGAEEYRVVLGIFHSYNRARAAAGMLMRSRTLAKVTVVSLPPRSTRQ